MLNEPRDLFSWLIVFLEAVKKAQHCIKSNFFAGTYSTFEKRFCGGRYLEFYVFYSAPFLLILVVFLLRTGESQAESSARAYFFPQLRTNFLVIIKIHKNNQNEVITVQMPRLNCSEMSSAKDGDNNSMPSNSSINVFN